MKQVKDLTQGPILSSLIKLSLPIIGTSFMQMAYNLTDMMWLGMLGSEAVASVGAASFFSWFGTSLLLITRIGAEVGVSQSVGRRDLTRASGYALHAIVWALILAGAYALSTIINASSLIGLLNLQGAGVHADATAYLRIVSLGYIFAFTNPTFQGIYNGAGNSRQPFYYLLVGLLINIVLDPLFIFGLGPIPAMGVEGAGWATVIAQVIVSLLFIISLFVKRDNLALTFKGFQLKRKISALIFRLGLPVAAEGAMFALFAMVLARLITRWGDVPLAVQSVGSQIEAISWMTASGLATALGAFTGQNFGSGNWLRIRKGYGVAIGVGVSLGLAATLSFLLFGKSIFSIFLNEPDALEMGVVYLHILAVSQVFMIVEILSRGAFNGIGRTMPPSLVGIIFTGLRIPLALLLMSIETIGMYGIWWAISISSIIKGLILLIWFLTILHRKASVNSRLSQRHIMGIMPSRIQQAATIVMLTIKGKGK